jgi:tetratricopeptide (TPR) repeat protein
VRAALDLAEPSPAWPTVIDRLRAATGTEGALGRARAAFVYALASDGEIAEARAELEKLKSSPTPHPLVGPLEHFIERSAKETDGGASEDAEDADEPEEKAEEEATDDSEPREETRATDFRKLLERAAEAKNGGNLGKAEELYRAARERDPGNIEALAGLGDVARLRGDTAAASNFYDGVLRANPSYLPALIARADMKWAGGDRTGAVAMYRRVLQQSGPGTPYGQRALAKINQVEGEGPASSPAPAPAEPATPAEPEPAAPEAPSGDTHIDTTDLPGFSE